MADLALSPEARRLLSAIAMESRAGRRFVGPPMPPTLATEGRPARINWQDLRAFSPIDYGQPATGASIAAIPTVPPAGPQLGELSFPAIPRLGPSSMDEAADLASQNRAAVMGADIATTAAAAHPVGRAVGMAGRAAQAAVRAAPRTVTGIAGATALTAAPGQAEPPSPLSTAQDTIARLRRSQADLEAERKRLTDELRRFDKLDPNNKEAVKNAQRLLGVAVDGIWSTKTGKAIDAYKKNVQGQIEALDKQAARLSNDLETQTRRLTGLEGAERLRAAEENVSPFSAALRSYGELMGTGLGLGIGGLSRWGLTRHANRAAAQRAADVEEMLARRMSAVPQRVGRLGEVWRQGGQGANPPFMAAPGTRYGVAPNPNAATTGQLFPAPRGIRGQVTGADLASVGAAGADIGVAEYRLAHAQDELGKALEAARTDPSEVNINRLQAARDEVAFWQSLSRTGQAAIVGYGGTATKVRRQYPRPDLSRADAELANLNRLIAPPKPARRRKK